MGSWAGRARAARTPSPRSRRGCAEWRSCVRGAYTRSSRAETPGPGPGLPARNSSSHRVEHLIENLPILHNAAAQHALAGVLGLFEHTHRGGIRRKHPRKDPDQIVLVERVRGEDAHRGGHEAAIPEGLAPPRT